METFHLSFDMANNLNPIFWVSLFLALKHYKLIFLTQWLRIYQNQMCCNNEFDSAN